MLVSCLPCRWHHFPPKHRLNFSRIHTVMCQNTSLLLNYFCSSNFRQYFSRRQVDAIYISYWRFEGKVNCCSSVDTVSPLIPTDNFRDFSTLMRIMLQDLAVEQCVPQLETKYIDFDMLPVNTLFPLWIFFPFQILFSCLSQSACYFVLLCLTFSLFLNSYAFIVLAWCNLFVVGVHCLNK